MNKYIIGVDGMRCGMCEMHVEEAIRKAIILRKVKASHTKNVVLVFTTLPLTKEDFEKVLEPTGYRLTSFEVVEAEKTLFGWR